MSMEREMVQDVADAIWAGLSRPEEGGFTESPMTWGGYIDPDIGIIDVCVSDMTEVAETVIEAARPFIEREAKVAALREAADWIEAHPENLDCEAEASGIAANRLRFRADELDAGGR